VSVGPNVGPPTQLPGERQLLPVGCDRRLVIESGSADNSKPVFDIARYALAVRAARSANVFVKHHAGGSVIRRPDDVIVEEPMEIRLDDVTIATTMRTPGNDYELAVGFCHSEGLLDGARVESVRYCAVSSAAESEFNVVSIETDGKGPTPVPRLGPTYSACGVCGSTQLESLSARLGPVTSSTPFSIAVVASMVESVIPHQELFDRTGGVHAAALIDVDGAVISVREDIGRHNAVDKIVGRRLLDGELPLTGLAMFVSSRASYEMVQKAWAAGASTLVAVSAPSALAIATAAEAGMTLVGFARGDSLNVYTGSLSQ